MPVPKLFMVLPAYNEEKNLPVLLGRCEEVFQRLASFGHEHAYVIVDDGSEDATPRILEEHRQRMPITVITHTPNQGLGPTLRDGLRAASEIAHEEDIIFSMDADNTHGPGLMLRMTERIIEGNDVVIASRYRPGARVVGLSLFRSLMSMGARCLFRLVFPIKGVRDYTCGFRAYRGAVIKAAFQRYGDAFVESVGFQSTADILLRLARMGVIFTEVPMILRYDLKGGASKMRVGATVWRTITLLLKRRFEGSSGHAKRS